MNLQEDIYNSCLLIKTYNEISILPLNNSSLINLVMRALLITLIKRALRPLSLINEVKFIILTRFKVLYKG